MGSKRWGYTKNSTLGVGRPTTAFSLYLQSVAGIMPKYKKRRLHGKAPIWRMDLLKCKFVCLPAAERKPLDDVAAAGLASARASQDAALRSGAGHVSSSSPFAAVAAQPAAPSAAVAADKCHVWMQVEVPHDAPPSEPLLARVQCRITWPALGGVEHTLESVAGR